MDLNKLKKMVDVVLHSGNTLEQYGRALQTALLQSGETHPQFMQDLVEALSANPSPLKLTDDEVVELVKRVPGLKKHREVMDKISPERQAQIQPYPALAQIEATYQAESLQDWAETELREI